MTFYKGDAREADRAIQLQKRRQQQQEDVEIKKKKIEEESKMTSIDNKFKAHYDAVEQMLRTDTIGLVTLEDMKKKRELIIQQREQQLAQERIERLLEEDAKREKKLMQKTECQKLSFVHDDDDDEQIPPPPPSIQEQNLEAQSLFKTKKRFGKNPNVDTSFLPDKDRDFEEDLLREKLRREWVEKQEKLKNEQIEIVYSYWDGTGHRRTTQLKKGQTIQQFLYKCLEQLRKENQFNELKISSVDQLMYVKEDIILPHHYTFYDLIVTKARGKSGPLFLFDCHDDVRIVSDATIEKEESHAGKVILRSWYERHKHIFPASRWEPYDPLKKWEGYTVKD